MHLFRWCALLVKYGIYLVYCALVIYCTHMFSWMLHFNRIYDLESRKFLQEGHVRYGAVKGLLLGSQAAVNLSKNDWLRCYISAKLPGYSGIAEIKPFITS